MNAIRSVNVLGGGIVGLTTALVLRQHKFPVTVLAKDLPGEPGNAHFASPSAGAHWRSWATANEVRLQKLEEASLSHLFRLAKEHPECGIVSTHSNDFWEETPKEGTRIWFEKLVPDFRTLGPEELLPGTVLGVSYRKVAINVPVYLDWVYRQCLDAGVKIRRLDHYLDHLDQAFDQSSSIVVNCTGLGARTLGGVEDADVYSVRGQWMLVRAPSVKTSVNVTTKPGKVAMMTTIIPRGDGTVFLGGTKESSSYDPAVYPETANIIWERCTSSCPELVSDFQTWQQAHPDRNRDDFILAQGAGLRPGRIGGPRLESQTWGTDRAVIHNYGHGGYGFQTSWSCAWEVATMVEALSKSEASN
ncbi:hypothetical protein IWQ62_003975 [Dispira parvispora]|uniref:FAD dependent oxidoreductase domain-containing protein n=1 Tax=Dispira parvispora TaxID=1520584 RepID=A0A9W8AQS4_9FUNG|nr:hypothetical protein IWQ62_003975 [Dispira parvispora]